MKRVLKKVSMLALIAASALAFSACGEEEYPKSGIPANEVLGLIPALNVDYGLARDVLKEKRKKDMEGVSNFEKAKKIEEAYDKKADALEAKHKADMAVEVAKVNAKSIPVTMSEKFKALNIEVESVKVSEGGNGFTFIFVAGEGFDMKSCMRTIGNLIGVTQIDFTTKAKDGSVISSNMTIFGPIDDDLKKKDVQKGQRLNASGVNAGGTNIGVGLYKEYADFASIEMTLRGEN